MNAHTDILDAMRKAAAVENRRARAIWRDSISGGKSKGGNGVAYEKVEMVRLSLAEGPKSISALNEDTGLSALVIRRALDKLGNRVDRETCTNGSQRWHVYVLRPDAAPLEPDTCKSAAELVCEILAQHPGASSLDVWQRSGLSRDRVRDVLRELTRKGTLIRSGTGTAGAPYCYEVAR